MSTITEDRVVTEDPRVDTIRNSEAAKELEKATTVTLGDLVRLGASMTEPALGWGDETQACALSAAGLAYEAMAKA
jgi:hypothetical protein